MRALAEIATNLMPHKYEHATDFLSRLAVYTEAVRARARAEKAGLPAPKPPPIDYEHL